MQVLNQLQNLESVNLARTKIADEGLKFIQNNPKIFWLNIEETKVSDKSVKYLKNLKRLSGLFLKGSKISEHGIKELNDSFENINLIPPQTKTTTK